MGGYDTTRIGEEEEENGNGVDGEDTHKEKKYEV